MRFYRVWREYEQPELNQYDLYAFTDEEAAADYMDRNMYGVEVEEVFALPNSEMTFTPYFELCKGMYGIVKGRFGHWMPEDFEED